MQFVEYACDFDAHELGTDRLICFGKHSLDDTPLHVDMRAHPLSSQKSAKVDCAATASQPATEIAHLAYDHPGTRGGGPR